MMNAAQNAPGAAAILLCAGKGTRMGDAGKNKVAFDCAGVPVISRIVRNLRAGGVSRFVVVVGYRAESVMAALDGEPGVLYAYQREQKGTGHAAACGLRVLEEIGFAGSVVVSMGDKIVSTRLVRELLARKTGNAQAVLGVQKRDFHPNGGHVLFADGKPLGIVEHADALRAEKTGVPVALAGRSFSAAEIFAAPFVNAALYCFDAAALGARLGELRSDNAQGELYLTDVVERFAAENALDFYAVDDPVDLLTYSTRPELRAVSRRFLRPASAFRAEAAPGSRRAALLDAFIARFGDRPCVVVSAPGRVNLMGRHVEHRGGSVNMMAIAARLECVVAPREDDRVELFNLDAAFPPASFSISERLPVSVCAGVSSCAPSASSAAWLSYLDSVAARADLEARRGSWANYVKGAVLRFQMATDLPLCGMDVVAAGGIPVAAGLSSSSALVVAAAEALVALNALNVSTRDFVDLCGEGEWYVGSRGGAGDHAAIKCSKRGRIVHLRFKPFSIGESVPFPSDHAIVVVESGEQAKKSEGAREKFNSRIRDYEAAFNEIKHVFPSLPVAYFRDVAFLPEADRAKALGVLTGTVRGVAEFGVKECRRAEEALDLLKRGDWAAFGEMMKRSHDGDRVGGGEYECSTPRIDALVDRLDAFPGVLGAQLVGAGLGGCVIALVRNDAADALLASLARDGYSAFRCSPSDGSRVEW